MVVLLAVCFSLAIEISQLLLMRGMFEWDDLISNGIGAILGCLVYMEAERRLPERRFSAIVFSASILFAVVCAGVYIVSA